MTALQTRDFTNSEYVTIAAVHRHSAAQTRVNALMALQRIRETRLWLRSQ